MRKKTTLPHKSTSSLVGNRCQFIGVSFPSETGRSLTGHPDKPCAPAIPTNCISTLRLERSNMTTSRLSLALPSTPHPLSKQNPRLRQCGMMNLLNIFIMSLLKILYQTSKSVELTWSSPSSKDEMSARRCRSYTLILDLAVPSPSFTAHPI
ncbi:hypothetical protein BU24DRAFT_236753 [Aaosphaeria arxii CBS 175.79]|uniref:Uncharacterized protein n=1 Tax=Aaosphaeria arxii CBS 175.79 TaxID=1450172 RepID=A0A6A5XJF1_9PLEO|nr:uncharacterized protein BU24DRAFT_236753 [Aaosphaeria arxii CBS 175.79]KAF2013395.1 hypothetical protein BU24DRAFT_236753 [Aaosphaeria arxii CBS 175.79]